MVFLTKKMQEYVDMLTLINDRSYVESVVKQIINEERKRILSELPRDIKIEMTPLFYIKKLLSFMFMPSQTIEHGFRAGINYTIFKVNDQELPEKK